MPEQRIAELVGQTLKDYESLSSELNDDVGRNMMCLSTTILQLLKKKNEAEYRNALDYLKLTEATIH